MNPRNFGQPTEIVNYTPHEIKIVGQNGEEDLTIESSGVARVETIHRKVGQVKVQGALVPVFDTEFGPVQGLPEQEDGVILVVSRMVSAALPERFDLAHPSQLVRDEDGRVVGAKGIECPNK